MDDGDRRFGITLDHIASGTAPPPLANWAGDGSFGPAGALGPLTPDRTLTRSCVNDSDDD